MKKEKFSFANTLKILFRDESFVQSFVIMIFMFLLIIFEIWDDYTLILFPLVTFGLFLYVETLRTLNREINSKQKILKVQPFGDYNVMSNRIKFCLYMQLIIVLFIGAESLYHPQLIDNHFIFYVITLGVLYIFGAYYPFYNLGLFSKIELATDIFFSQPIDLNLESLEGENANILSEIEEELKIDNKNKDNFKSDKILDSKSSKSIILSKLKFKDFIFLHKIITINFLLAIILWILFSVLAYSNSLLVITINLPGSDLLEGMPLQISLIIYLILIEVPIVIILIFKKSMNSINKIDVDYINEIADRLCRSRVQKIVLQNIINAYFGIIKSSEFSKNIIRLIE
ncbi:MAG: hypothetical protein ACTSRZ_05340 [Promethearchaeota archaeon]